MEAVEDRSASDVFNSLKCVHIKYKEVVVRTANEELKTLQKETEDCVAICLKTT